MRKNQATLANLILNGLGAALLFFTAIGLMAIFRTAFHYSGIELSLLYKIGLIVLALTLGLLLLWAVIEIAKRIFFPHLLRRQVTNAPDLENEFLKQFESAISNSNSALSPIEWWQLICLHKEMRKQNEDFFPSPAHTSEWARCQSPPSRVHEKLYRNNIFGDGSVQTSRKSRVRLASSAHRNSMAPSRG